jgi:predicted PhzF superfamily epimerase YddE/YHI9
MIFFGCWFSLGLPEDHATGSAQCALASYYFKK